MKKLLFLPLLFLALFTVTSCDSNKETPNPTSELTETEQNLYGNWKKTTEDYKYYDVDGNVVFSTGQSDMSDMFEYKEDGTLTFTIAGASPSTRKYELKQENDPKMLNIFNAAGTEIEISYKIEKLTATEMVLVHEYENAEYMEDGEDKVAAKAVKRYIYAKQ